MNPKHLIASGLFFILTSSFCAPAFADSNGEILSRLAAIEEKQDRILANMEKIKSELEIVKIRVSLKN